MKKQNEEDFAHLVLAICYGAAPVILVLGWGLLTVNFSVGMFITKIALAMFGLAMVMSAFGVHFE